MTIEDPFPFEIIPVSWNNPYAIILRQKQKDEFALRYPEDLGEPGKQIDQEDCLVFLLIRKKIPTRTDEIEKDFEDKRYVGAAGLRKVDESRVEIKRMFISPEVRGPPFRLAERLIKSLEKNAKDFGFKNLLIETGNFNKQALNFYHRVGFIPCSAFPPYDKEGEAPQSVFLEKEIIE